MRIGIAFLGAFGLLLSGCATVATRPLSSSANGIAYQLPLGKMRLRVVEDDGVLSVLLDGPIVGGDPAHRLVAQLPQSGVADNNVTVSIDPKTQLLSKVEVTSTGRLTDILTNIAKIPAYLQASDGSSGVTLFSETADIDALDATARAANAVLADYYQTLCGGATTTAALPFAQALTAAGQTADDDKTFLKDRLRRCRRMNLVGAEQAVARGLIAVEVSPAVAPGAAPAGWPAARAVSPTDLAACATGICYRPYLSRTVTLKVRGAFVLSDVFLVPDVDTLIHVDLPAGVFAEQKYTLTFSDGVLTSYQRNGKSELVGLSALPVAIATAILSAPAEALGVKQKGLEAQTNYLTALNAAVEKKTATAAACAKAPTLCPDTAYRLIGGPVNGTPAGGSGPVQDQGGAPVNQGNGGAPVDGG